jgi:hypothetical protein
LIDGGTVSGRKGILGFQLVVVEVVGCIAMASFEDDD